jgi:hypothetical protein
MPRLEFPASLRRLGDKAAHFARALTFKGTNMNEQLKAAVSPAAINRWASEIRLLRSLQLYQTGGCALNPSITTAIAKPIDATRRGIQTGILEPRGLLPSCITVLLI